jgi:hypothetical protein
MYFARILMAVALTLIASGGRAEIVRDVWDFTCYGEGRPFEVVWEGPIKTLHVIGQLTRRYPGFLVQHEGWFEVFAKRSDQERMMHLIVHASDEAVLSVLHSGYADPDVECSSER